MVTLQELHYRKSELQEQIKYRQKNIWLLLDFAIGYKQLHCKRILPEQINECRLINTIKNLHEQRRAEQKELMLLNQLINQKLEEKTAWHINKWQKKLKPL